MKNHKTLWQCGRCNNINPSKQWSPARKFHCPNGDVIVKYRCPDCKVGVTPQVVTVSNPEPLFDGAVIERLPPIFYNFGRFACDYCGSDEPEEFTNTTESQDVSFQCQCGAEFRLKIEKDKVILSHNEGKAA